MSQPMTVDLPHKLGKEAARARIESGLGKLAGYVPGGSVTDNRWDGDTLHFTVEAMGQRVATQLLVMEDKVRATFELPMFLSMFGEKVKSVIEREGPKLLR